MAVMKGGGAGWHTQSLNIYVNDPTLPITRLVLTHSNGYDVVRFTVNIYQDIKPDLSNKQLIVSDNVKGAITKTYTAGYEI